MKICGKYEEDGLGYCRRCDWSGLMHLWPGPAAEREPYRSDLLLKRAMILWNIRSSLPRQTTLFEEAPKSKGSWQWLVRWFAFKLSEP